MQSSICRKALLALLTCAFGAGTARADYLYVTNFSQPYIPDAISTIAPDGTVATFATGFNDPHGIAFDGHGNLFVANAIGSYVSEVSPSGVVTPFAPGASANQGIAFDSNGDLFVADGVANVVEEIHRRA